MANRLHSLRLPTFRSSRVPILQHLSSDHGIVEPPRNIQSGCQSDEQSNLGTKHTMPTGKKDKKKKGIKKDKMKRGIKKDKKKRGMSASESESEEEVARKKDGKKMRNAVYGKPAIDDEIYTEKIPEKKNRGSVNIQKEREMDVKVLEGEVRNIKKGPTKKMRSPRESNCQQESSSNPLQHKKEREKAPEEAAGTKKKCPGKRKICFQTNRQQESSTRPLQPEEEEEKESTYNEPSNVKLPRNQELKKIEEQDDLNEEHQLESDEKETHKPHEEQDPSSSLVPIENLRAEGVAENQKPIKKRSINLLGSG